MTDTLPPWAQQARDRDWAILDMLNRPGWWDRKVTARLREDENGCLLWTGGKHERGYGHVYVRRADGTGFAAKVHRVTWIERHRRPLPMGHVLDHMCGIHECANVDHLDAVSQDENLQRSKAVRTI
jgi:HNH endonuclease